MSAFTAQAVPHKKFSWGEYLRESTHPLASLLVITPVLVIYELGVLALGPAAMRNGADVWLRNILEWVGLGQYFLLPVATCAILLAWHHIRHEPWRWNGRVLLGMFLEAVLLALLLLVLARLQASMTASLRGPLFCGAGLVPGPQGWSRLVAFLGAGIYEEFLFRLLLLPVVFGLLRLAGCSLRSGAVVAIITSSLLFAAAHYQFFISHGDIFQWSTFVFRFLAGIYFALLLVYRGFGIVACTHAIYDVLAGVL